MESDTLNLRRSSMIVSSSNKSTSASPRVSKIRRLPAAKMDPEPHSPQQSPRPSVERSPRFVSLKPTGDRSMPRIISSDKQSRPLKGSELQAQLAQLQDELKEVKEKLASEEKEKSRALEELAEARRVAEEVSEKLDGALLSLKLAEESSELDKFRADEMEQSAIEATRKREEEWLQELENARNQHAVDVAALFSATQELMTVKHELVMTTEAKNAALNHANDALKIAEINAEKVETLSGEISHLKSLLESKLESHSKEVAEIISKFNSEAELLKFELCKAKKAEEMLVDVNASVEVLKVQIHNAKVAESNSHSLIEEQKKKIELLESQLEEAGQSESAVKHSFASVMKQLEERTVLCYEAESEINSLYAKVESLDHEVAMHKEDLKLSNKRRDLAVLEVLAMKKEVEVLKREVQKVEEEKAHTLNNEKIACLNVESLTLENNKLLVELEITKEESRKAKEAMESLASALHQLSLEIRETQDRLLIKQSQFDNASAEADELRSALKNAHEKYEHSLDEAKYEIARLKRTVEKSETEAKDLRLECHLKEHTLISVIQKSEEEFASIKLQKDNVIEMLERQKDEAKELEIEASKLMDKMWQVETELVMARKSLEEMMAENLKLKERLLDKEYELQNQTQENDEFRIRDASALEKVMELSNLLTKLASRKSVEKGDIRGNEKNRENVGHNEFDVMPMTSEAIQEINGNSTQEQGAFSEKVVEIIKKDAKLMEIDDSNGNTEENHNDHENIEKEMLVRKEVKLYESYKAIDEQLSSEREGSTESQGDEFDLKIENNHHDHVNGENAKNGHASPYKLLQQHKKKKALLHKFGSILKNSIP